VKTIHFYSFAGIQWRSRCTGNTAK